MHRYQRRILQVAFHTEKPQLQKNIYSVQRAKRNKKKRERVLATNEES